MNIYRVESQVAVDQLLHLLPAPNPDPANHLHDGVLEVRKRVRRALDNAYALCEVTADVAGQPRREAEAASSSPLSSAAAHCLVRPLERFELRCFCVLWMQHINCVVFLVFSQGELHFILPVSDVSAGMILVINGYSVGFGFWWNWGSGDVGGPSEGIWCLWCLVFVPVLLPCGLILSRG